MKNLITKKLALLAIVLFASIGHAFGANISVTTNNENAVDWRLSWPGNNNWTSGSGAFDVDDGVEAFMELTWIDVLYNITGISVDGSSVDVETFRSEGYTWSNIQGNHTVNITLDKLPTNIFNVEFNYDNVASVFFSYNNDRYGMGFFSDGELEIPSGGDVNMFVNQQSSAYPLNKVLVDDVDVTNQINNGQYVFSNLSADHYVKVFLDKVENTNSISVSFNEGFDPSFYFEDDGKTWWNPQNAEFATGNDVKLIIDPSYGILVSKIYVTNKSTNDKTDVTESYQANGYYEFSYLSADYAVEVELEYVGVSKIYVDYDSSKANVNLLDYSADPNNGTLYNIGFDGNEFTKGSNVRLYISPYGGYVLESILVDERDVTSTYLENNYYEFLDLNADHTIKVQFRESVPVTISYTFNREDVAGVFVSWNTGATNLNGTSSITVMEGSDVRMTNDWLDESYRIKSFKVDGIDYTETFINEGYSLSNVTSDLSVYVELETIEPSYAMNVTFNHDGLGEVCFDDSHYNRCVNHAQTVDVAAGEDIWVYVNLFSLAHPLKSIKVDDTDVTNGVKQNGGYSIPNISSNHSVYVEFDELPYNTISVNWQEGNADVYFVEGNFTLWGQEAQIVSGHNAKMYITPTAGCAISNVSISDGSSTQDITDTFNANGGYYEFTSVNVDYTVTVQFTEVDTHTITLNFANEKGWVYINDSQVGSYEYTYNEGSTIRLRINAREGYKVGSILVDDSEVTEAYKANGCYEFVLNSNSVVTVNFVEATYYTISLTGDDTEKGDYYLSHEGSIVEETDVYLYVYPNTGYVPTATVDENEVDLSYNQEYGYYYYLISNLDANHTVNVTFGEKHISYVHLSINKNETKEVYLSNNSRPDSGDFRLTTGTTVRLVAYPQIGYELESIYIDNTDITESYMENGYYDLVVTECTITVTMKKKTAPSTVTVTIPSSGVGTFCCEYDLNFSGVSGIKAYVASGYDPSTGDLVLTRVNDVPVGTGLLIKGTPGDYNVSSGNSNYIFANMLRGVVEQTTIRTEQWLYDGWNGERYYTSYILDTDGEFNIADNAYQVPANSAYLVIPSEYVNTSMAKLHNIFLDDEEEINGITTGVGFIWAGEKRNATATDDVYNLQGQKVNSKTLKPGIYIKNGKKFMVK